MQTPYRKPSKFSNLKPDPHITEGKAAELTKKLARLRASQPAAAAEVKRLAEMGDFSENAAYQIAKGRLRGINQGILDIESHLKTAIIIQPSTNHDRVQLHCTVTVANKDKQRSYQILGSSETDPVRGIISHNSPIGQALMGHRVGDTVTVSLPDKQINYTILKIE